MSILQRKTTLTVARAVAVHFLCSTLPICGYFVVTLLKSRQLISAYTSELCIKVVLIIMATEMVVNAYVFVTRIPGLRQSFAMHTANKVTSIGVSVTVKH
jgi:hypothetical protein